MEIVYHIKPFAELSVGELHAAASLRERVFYLEQHVTTLDADEKDPFSLFLWAECEGQTVGFLPSRCSPAPCGSSARTKGRVQHLLASLIYYLRYIVQNSIELNPAQLTRQEEIFQRFIALVNLTSYC